MQPTFPLLQVEVKGKIPLHLTSESGDVETMKTLLTVKATIDAQCQLFTCAMICACMFELLFIHFTMRFPRKQKIFQRRAKMSLFISDPLGQEEYALRASLQEVALQ